MSMLGGVEGDWGPDQWSDPEGTTANNGPQVHTNSVLTGSTDSQGQDKWTGMFGSLIGKVADYAIARDAAKTGLVRQTAANGQPIYTAQPRPIVTGSLNVGAIAIIGAAIVGGLLLVAAKKG